MIHACIDVTVDPALAAEAARSETPENEPLVIPGTYMGNTNLDARFSATILTGKKWENGRTLKIAFSEAFPAVVLEKVKQRFRVVESFVNLKFEFVEDWGSADIRVANDLGQGSWSYVGTDNKTIDRSKATMNFGWLKPDTADPEYDRVVVHEAFHMLGMPHEHQHPNNGIPWDKPKVYEYYMGPPNNWSREQVDHNLFRKYSETVTQFTEFDRESIMLYPIPNEFTVGDWWAGRNTKPSPRDVAFLAEQYPKPQAPTKPAPTGPKTMSRFDFAKAPIASLVQELTLTYNKTPFGRFLPLDRS
jgi:serralysin